MQNYLKLPLTLFILMAVAACKAVDLRSEDLKAQKIHDSEQRGRKLLSEAKTAMGYDKLEHTTVYEASVKFDWNGAWLLMPMNAFPGNNKKDMQLRLATNSFDGQVEYQSGRKKNDIQGVQSWQGYKAEAGEEGLKLKKNKRYVWGLATYHYLLEAPMHLPDAEIVRYAGLKEVGGTQYETVYVTWGSEAPNKEYDRLLAYINPQTKHIDLLEVTINDFFLPMPKGMQHATARYERKKTSLGAYLPSDIQIQLKGPKKLEKKVYSFSLVDYKFDSFDKSLLYPLEGVEYIGFRKPHSK